MENLTSDPIATSPRFPRSGPMRAGNVPKIDLRYWVAISAASVFGCNLGDFVSLYLRLGHWIGLFPLAAMFLALLIGERRSKWSGEAWYWVAVIILRTAATNVADLATHTFNLPHPWVIAAVECLQVLVILPTIQTAPANLDAVRLPTADGWYWASLLTAGVLGTVVGDGVAEDLHLGAGGGTLVLGAIMLLFIGLGANTLEEQGHLLAAARRRACGRYDGRRLVGLPNRRLPCGRT